MIYNGWSNYETWNVALWLNNDELIYKFITNSLKNLDSTYKKIDFLKELIENSIPDNLNGFYLDILNKGLSNIDYYELINSYGGD